jgi:hypothetical protein
LIEHDDIRILFRRIDNVTRQERGMLGREHNSKFSAPIASSFIFSISGVTRQIYYHQTGVLAGWRGMLTTVHPPPRRLLTVEQREVVRMTSRPSPRRDSLDFYMTSSLNVHCRNKTTSFYNILLNYTMWQMWYCK